MKHPGWRRCEVRSGVCTGRGARLVNVVIKGRSRWYLCCRQCADEITGIKSTMIDIRHEFDLDSVNIKNEIFGKMTGGIKV